MYQHHRLLARDEHAVGPVSSKTLLMPSSVRLVVTCNGMAGREIAIQPIQQALFDWAIPVYKHPAEPIFACSPSPTIEFLSIHSVTLRTYSLQTHTPPLMVLLPRIQITSRLSSDERSALVCHSECGHRHLSPSLRRLVHKGWFAESGCWIRAVHSHVHSRIHLPDRALSGFPVLRYLSFALTTAAFRLLLIIALARLVT